MSHKYYKIKCPDTQLWNKAVNIFGDQSYESNRIFHILGSVQEDFKITVSKEDLDIIKTVENADVIDNT